MRSVISLGLVSLSVVSALAAVVPRQGAVTPLTTAQTNVYTPYSWFASTAYCDPSTTINWSCGTNCNGNPGFLPTASGGDGGSIQFWYVGFDPSLNTVVVAHQGTDSSNIIADLTDADFFLASLDPTLFPGISSSIEVHDGFRDSHARSAPAILAAVQQTMSAHSTNSVTIVGHSLGAALALIDAVYLPLHLPSTTKFKMVGYGMPRVGNPAFAQYLDAHFADLTHINNKEDVVPILPGRFLGFQHPHGEVHITDSNVWESCSGDDNTSNLCIVGDVSNIFDGATGDHAGPYNGIRMGC